MKSKRETEPPPLNRYREKRRFDRTPEPAGDAPPAPAGWRFVVQEHHARRLHWDLRIEIGGTLKSWAVPKGLTLDPREKRLAVRTEDHPLEYADFEGEIPEGNYGAGHMIVWDRGVWVPEPGAPVEERLRAGELKFSLKGRKLRGGFALVRLKRRDPKQEEWLLLKHRDSYAEEGWTVEAHPGSVSGEPAASPGGLEGAAPAAMPGTVDVMLASPAATAFSGPGWLFEIKWDGMRTAALVDHGLLRLHSRTGRDVTSSFPELALLPERLMARQAVIDGEIVVLDDGGRSDFERLQKRMHTDRPSASALRENPADYYAFDLLYCDGYDLRRTPLTERKRLLREVLDVRAPIRYSDHVEEYGQDLFALATARGAEGVVAKRMDSLYEAGRGAAWIKVKAVRELDAVVGGYTAPRGAGRAFGALLAGLFQGGRLEFLGGVGTGFDAAAQEELRRKLDALQVPECPFAAAPDTTEPVQWVRPELVIRVKYQTMTQERRLRAPVYLGLRHDVSPAECTVEAEAPAAAAPPFRLTTSIPVLRGQAIERELREGQRDEAILELDGKPVRVRNLNKIYFPGPEIKKRRLLEWYYRIAPVLLPFLQGRPLVLHRYPNGVTGQPFYQKDAGDEKPDWMRTIRVADAGRGRTIEYYVADDRAALLFLANLGCIEHNPWSSSRPDLERPDYVFFDLDPVEGASFATVVAVAREIHRLLEEIGCASFLKTSGASGLHVYLPLEPRYTYEQARSFAEILARVIHARRPRETTLERMTAKRPAGTVYLDYSQNGYGRPLASVYSVRPRAAATVSAPLVSAELRAGLRPEQFTLRTMSRRLAEKGDLWAGFWSRRQALEEPLRRLAGILAGG